ncbi:P63C domain-containing protein [uncultured Rhodoblastus sp.]|uniref:P63C domain-containing protein n=1 Tax=uncultured Rhodoblastus sp. TaxID=543037 RepID=UPI0025D42FCC|nr:P63C domain-containing protein [uncultured Rhodoblastus sp.]
MTESSKSAGGRARALALSPERRSEIARRAGASRWGTLRQAISREGIVKVGDTELQCYVLDDETRVLARASFVRAIGRTGKVKGGRGFDEEFQTPVFLTAENLKSFFPSDLDVNSKPILFMDGDAQMIGYRAELLPDVCDIFADADRAGVLRANQKHIATACRTLSRGLTRVGIIGLIDEATGYQRERAADALARILENYIAKELQPWVQTFPPEFYDNLFRLRGLHYPRDTVKRPQYFGYLTNDVIYKRLAPGIVDELKRLTPKLPSGRRKHQYFRRLTENLGHPKLREHLASVITVMMLSDTYDDFMVKLDRVKPRYGETMALPFDSPTTGL